MTEKKGFFERAFENMKEDAKKQRKIDKENYATVKAEVNPDFQEFKDAKGLKGKAKVVINHIERDGKAIADENRENYKKLLEEQRERNNKNINK